MSKVSPRFVGFEFSTSTADDEANYFTGEAGRSAELPDIEPLPPGTYRVMEGEFYLVVDQPSPHGEKPKTEPD